MFSKRKNIQVYPDHMLDYGINVIIRQHTEFYKKVPLPCHWEHGWTAFDRPLKTDLATEKSFMLVFNKRRLEAWQRENEKPAYILGSPFPLYRKMNNIAKDIDAKGTIAFPVHSGTSVHIHFDLDVYCTELNSLPDKFKPVTVCLHIRDVEKGWVHFFKNKGFNVVTAGEINSYSFVVNFYNILKRHKYATSNDIGSHLFYCVDMNIPFFILGRQPVFVNTGKDPNVPDRYSTKDFYFGMEVYNLFNTGPVDNISDDQKKLVDRENGFNDAVSSDDLKKAMIVEEPKTQKFKTNKIKSFARRVIFNICNKHIVNQKRNCEDILHLVDRYTKNTTVNGFYFESYFEKTGLFVESMKVNEFTKYSYSFSSIVPNIYSSVFAFLTRQLIGENTSITDNEKKIWIENFNSFQKEDGLFVDPVLENSDYYNLDWWGARHLPPLLIICYTYLNSKPRYEFNYIKKYYDYDILRQYLESLEFENIKGTDSDNAIMNLGVMLQYQRDFFNDKKAGEALLVLFEELEKKINPETGSWGNGSNNDKEYISRAQQFAYHLYSLWLYDKREIIYKEKLIDLTLSLQNVFGGFGVKLNSSACEDIDAIDLLIKLSKLTDYRKEDIRKAIQKAFVWVLANQNDDGGFVFRINEPLTYGHFLMRSLKNESHLFATWFRTLSIAYLTDYLGIENNFNIGNCPGYHFKIQNG